MRSWMAYAIAGCLVLATIPMYRHILERARRPDADVSPAATLQARAPTGYEPPLQQPVRQCSTGMLHGPCDDVLVINEALGYYKARCVGDTVYRLKRHGTITVVEPWPTQVKCFQ